MISFIIRPKKQNPHLLFKKWDLVGLLHGPAFRF